MANPLTRREEEQVSIRKMRPGDQRPITGKDGQIMNLIRTERPYQCDLADCYNHHMSDSAKAMGLVWLPMPNGEVKLDFSYKATAENLRTSRQREDRDRYEWMRAHGYLQDRAA